MLEKEMMKQVNGLIFLSFVQNQIQPRKLVNIIQHLKIDI